MIFIDVHPDYKRTSLAKYVKVFDRFLEGLARSRKGEMLKKSGEFMNISQLPLACVILGYPLFTSALHLQLNDEGFSR